MPLSTDNDFSFEDDGADPSKKRHQQDHDALHAQYNEWEGLVPSDFTTSNEGLLADIPAASTMPGGFYFATDEDGGTLYRSNGSDWSQVAPGVDVPAGTEIFHASIAANVGPFTAGSTYDVTGLSGTIPAGLNRPMMAMLYMSHMQFSDSGATANVFICESDNTAVDGSGGYPTVATTATGQSRGVVNYARIASGFSGTIKARINPVGSGTVTVLYSAGFTSAFLRVVTC